MIKQENRMSVHNPLATWVAELKMEWDELLAFVIMGVVLAVIVVATLANGMVSSSPGWSALSAL